MTKVPKVKACAFSAHYCIVPVIKYLDIVIPAKAGIQVGTGCRIKSGKTGGVY